MGLCKTSIFSIFTFINANDLKFCTRSYSSCVYCTTRFKGSNGKVCEMMTSHFRTLLIKQKQKNWCWNRSNRRQICQSWCPGHSTFNLILCHLTIQPLDIAVKNIWFSMHVKITSSLTKQILGAVQIARDSSVTTLIRSLLLQCCGRKDACTMF